MTAHKLGRVIFIRHGESIWNIDDSSRNLVTRFTGWADVPLTSHGVHQAAAAGRCLKMFGIHPDAVFTSLLRRSRESFDEIAKSETSKLLDVPIISSWRLNERHYGALVGLSKLEAETQMGRDKVMEWRRSWDTAPPELDPRDMPKWNKVDWAKPKTVISHRGRQSTTSIEKGITVPKTESLHDCAVRVQPLWLGGILPRVLLGETVLVVAHANSIRAMIRHIDHATMTTDNLRDVHIPSAIPLVYSFKPHRPSTNLMQGHRQNVLDMTNKNISAVPVGDPTRLGMTGRYLVSKEVMEMYLNKPNHNELDDGGDSGTGKTSIYDLVDKGLTDVVDYSDHGDGKSEALVITDGRGVIMHSNQKWEELCGFNVNEIRGKTSAFLQGPLTSQKVIDEMDEKLASGLPTRTSVVNYRKNGNAFRNDITIVPVYDWLNKSDLTTSESIETKSDSLNTEDQFVELPLDLSGSNSMADTWDDYHQAQMDKYINSFNNSTVPKNSGRIMEPSHFIGKLEITPDLHNLTPLTESEKLSRDLNR